MDELRRQARFCYGCGQANAYGLRLRFALIDGVATTRFTPGPEHQGYPGFLHGGLVAVILDEALGWTTYGNGVWTVTAKLTIRLRQPIPIGLPVEARAWISRERQRWVEGRAELRASDSSLLAEASGLLVPVPRHLEAEIRRRYTDDPPL